MQAGRAGGDASLAAARALRARRQRDVGRAGAVPPGERCRPKGTAPRCRFVHRPTGRGGPRLRSVETELVRAARTGAARRSSTGRRSWSTRGPQSLRIWTGLEPPLETMRKAMQSTTDEGPGERNRMTDADRRSHLRPVPGPGGRGDRRPSSRRGRAGHPRASPRRLRRRPLGHVRHRRDRRARLRRASERVEQAIARPAPRAARPSG